MTEEEPEAPVSLIPVDMGTLDERAMLDLLHLRYSVDPGNGPRFVCAEKVRSTAGFGDWRNREKIRTADFMALGQWVSDGLPLHGFEVKVSRTDWKRELDEPSKSAPFRAVCDYWWLVCPPGVAGRHELPPDWGMLTVLPNLERRRDLVTGEWFDTPVLRVAKAAPRLGGPVSRDLPRPFMVSLMKAAARTARNQAERQARVTEPDDLDLFSVATA